MISTIWREAFPPPRRPLTTSLGVISLGCKRASEGARHSAISQVVSAVKTASFPVGRYRAYGKPSNTFLRLPIRAAPLSPIHLAVSAEQDKCGFFAIGACAKDVTRLQTADEETHPVPSRLLRGAKTAAHPRLALASFTEWTRKLVSLKFSPPLGVAAEYGPRALYLSNRFETMAKERPVVNCEHNPGEPGESPERDNTTWPAFGTDSLLRGANGTAPSPLSIATW